MSLVPGSSETKAAKGKKRSSLDIQSKKPKKSSSLNLKKKNKSTAKIPVVEDESIFNKYGNPEEAEQYVRNQKKEPKRLFSVDLGGTFFLQNEDSSFYKSGGQREDLGQLSSITEEEEKATEVENAFGIPAMTIKKHDTSDVTEHSPDTLCCLALKMWAVALLDITHNSHTWTKWARNLIKQVKHHVATVRGDIVLPGGQKKVLLKSEWRKFIEEANEKISVWRNYSDYIKELSKNIIEKSKGKTIICCPKCLEDNLIKDAVDANHIMNSLKEAISYATYWRCLLDNMVNTSEALTQYDDEEHDESESEDDDDSSEEGCVRQQKVTGVLEKVKGANCKGRKS